VEPPQTQYAGGPDGAVAYQVFGEGPLDIMFIPDWTWHVDVWWDEPHVVRFFKRLGSFGRVILFDKRGTGASDPVPLGALPTIEQWVDDVGVVMDAAGSERAAVVSWGFGSLMGLTFAASNPDRTSSLVIVDGTACMPRRDDYPAGAPERIVEPTIDMYLSQFGRAENPMVDILVPSLKNDASVRRWIARAQRAATSPEATRAIWNWGFKVDVRGVLQAISVPTLVMHRRDDRFLAIAHGRYIAEHVEGARFVELPGNDHHFYSGDFDPILDEIQEFLTGARSTPEADRVLSTVLFTDLVGSTERAAELGDHRWRDVLDSHDEISRQHVERFRGRFIKTTGDGVLATFDGPARAVRCATAICEEVTKLGIEIRTGLHTGEVELRGEDVGGIAVNLAARVMAEADAGETLVSSTVKDLVVGSGIEFADRGVHALKGIPGEWRLFSVA
jgi:class 3 adenylate cyclase/pimeloyl-ACP methyl ester carboxylesterase